jgi:hypothetical protein
MVITVVTILPVIVYYLNRFVRQKGENDIKKEAVVVEAPPKSPVGDATTEGIEGMVTEEAVDIIER